MTLTRRDLLATAAAGALAKVALDAPLAFAAPPARIRAVAFDGFPILDPRPIVALAKALYPEHGEEFFGLFRTRLFEYQWLRALGGQYKDFFSIIEDAHRFAAAQLGLDATGEKRARLREAFLALKAWPDVAAALQTLKAKGIRLAFLSNMTPRMLEAGISNSQLEGVFDFVVSTDAIKTYKPDPRPTSWASMPSSFPSSRSRLPLSPDGMLRAPLGLATRRFGSIGWEPRPRNSAWSQLPSVRDSMRSSAS